MLSAEESAGSGDLYGEVTTGTARREVSVGRLGTSACFSHGVVASWRNRTDRSRRTGMEEFRRLTRLPAYVFNITSELKAAARKRGEDIVDFGMGNPDGATPKHIVDKLIEAAQRTATHRYSLSRGVPRLRRAICNWYKTRYDVDLDPESEAIVTIGSKEGIAHLTLGVCDRGDCVLVPNPSYPIHIYGPVIAGADIQQVPMVPSVDFIAELEKAIKSRIPKPKMLILNFPANPTAQCAELDFF